MVQRPEPEVVAPEKLAPDLLGTDVFARDALAPDILLIDTTPTNLTADVFIDPSIAAHVDTLMAALADFRVTANRLVNWGHTLADVLSHGGRLLVAGNGGSAAEAAHLAGELVGGARANRPPHSAIALASDPATMTAIGGDTGFVDVFARQVRAHGRAGDVLLTLSTSGRTENLLEAVLAARSIGVTSWALTGPAPNPLAQISDDALPVSGVDAPTVQELHLVAVHVLCQQVEAALASGADSRPI
jgi:D-sedoheptulose 7-phosphate isomerase